MRKHKNKRLYNSVVDAVLNSYIAGEIYEVYIRQNIDHVGFYEVYVYLLGDRMNTIYAHGKTGAETVIKVAENHGVNIYNIK